MQGAHDLRIFRLGEFKLVQPVDRNALHERCLFRVETVANLQVDDESTYDAAEETSTV